MSKKSLLLDQALEFSTKNSQFSFEDTVDRCYRDIVEAVESLGLQRIPYRKKSKVEKKKLPSKEIVKLISTLNENDIDFKDLSNDQICNHFEGIHYITTKQGFCELSKEMIHVSEDCHMLTPRSYNLGDPIHRDEFIDDYRINAALSLIKMYFLQRIMSILYPEKDIPMIDSTNSCFLNALIACIWQIRIKIHGEWPAVDNSKYFKDKETSLTEEEWYYLVEYSYVWIESDSPIMDKYAYQWFQELFSTSNSIKQSTLFQQIYRQMTSFDWKVFSILQQFVSFHKQFYLDGYKNIWILKSPDSSCGIGMKILYKLEDILDLERKMNGRTVQKYIEIPLLVPTIHKGLDLPSMKLSSENVKTSKFDMRIWVLITSFQPMKAYIYSSLYGRKCGISYKTNVQTLTDLYCHLTNYTVQKKKIKIPVNKKNNMMNKDNSKKILLNEDENQSQANETSDLMIEDDGSSLPENIDMICDDDNIDDEDEIKVFDLTHVSSTPSLNKPPRNTFFSSSIPSAPKRLRQICQDYRKDKNENSKVDEESDLLLDHQELIDLINLSYNKKVASSSRSFSSSSILSDQQQSNYNNSNNNTNIWETTIWPKICEKIYQTLLVLAQKITPRTSSYEFLGYDIMLDQSYEPWILEVNMSPAMAHRTTRQSVLIKEMACQLVQLAIAPKLNLSGFYSSTISSTMGEEGPLSSLLHQFRQENSSYLSKYSYFIPLHPLQENQNNCNKNNNEDDKGIKEREEIVPVISLKDWGDTKSSSAILRPSSSASRLRPKTANNNNNNNNYKDGQETNNNEKSNSNMNFIVTGKAIGYDHMIYIDFLIKQFDNIIKLQKWFRKYAIRCRLYHIHRTKQIIKIQTIIRRYFAIQQRQYRMELKQTIFIQKYIRKFLAICTLNRLKKIKSSIKIQSYVRCWLAKQTKSRLFQQRTIRCIIQWIRKHRTHYIFQQYRKLLVVYHTYKQQLYQYSIIIWSLLHGNMYRKKSSKRIIGCWTVRWWKNVKQKRKLSLQMIAREAIPMANKIHQQYAQQYHEHRCMFFEERHMKQHIILEENKCIMMMFDVEEMLYDLIIKDLIWSSEELCVIIQDKQTQEKILLAEIEEENRKTKEKKEFEAKELYDKKLNEEREAEQRANIEKAIETIDSFLKQPLDEIIELIQLPIQPMFQKKKLLHSQHEKTLKNNENKQEIPIHDNSIKDNLQTENQIKEKVSQRDVQQISSISSNPQSHDTNSTSLPRPYSADPTLSRIAQALESIKSNPVRNPVLLRSYEKATKSPSVPLLNLKTLNIPPENSKKAKTTEDIYTKGTENTVEDFIQKKRIASRNLIRPYTAVNLRNTAPTSTINSHYPNNASYNEMAQVFLDALHSTKVFQKDVISDARSVYLEDFGLSPVDYFGDAFPVLPIITDSQSIPESTQDPLDPTKKKESKRLEDSSQRAKSPHRNHRSSKNLRSKSARQKNSKKDELMFSTYVNNLK